MTDRATLEIVAHGLGIDLDLNIRPDRRPLFCSERGFAVNFEPGWWNPLKDTEAAIDIAARLQIDICHTTHAVAAGRADDEFFSQVILGNSLDARKEAMRRAIVEVAAYILRDKN